VDAVSSGGIDGSRNRGGRCPDLERSVEMALREGRASMSRQTLPVGTLPNLLDEGLPG
jgi:hypothetical protein